MVVLLLGAILLCFPARNIGFNNEKATFLNDGWTYVKGDGTRTPIELPADLDTPAGEAAVIEYVLPETLPPQSTICLRASMQSVRAYLDDELIYEFGIPLGENQSMSGAYCVSRNSMVLFARGVEGLETERDVYLVHGSGGDALCEHPDGSGKIFFIRNPPEENP